MNVAKTKELMLRLVIISLRYSIAEIKKNIYLIIRNA